MNAGVTKWTINAIALAIQVLGQHEHLDEAIESLSRRIGFQVTRHGLDSALTKAGHQPAFQHLKKRPRGIPPIALRDTERFPVADPADLPDDAWTTAPAPVSRPPVVIVDDVLDAPHERFASLVELVKKQSRKGGISLEQLCDDLEMSPKAVRAYLTEAKEIGLTIEVAHEKLLFRAPEPSPSAPPVAVAPAAKTGRDHRIGVFSDLHFGSLYCLKSQFTEFVNKAYELGVRDFFCPGDTIEGCYRHAQFERSSESLEDQQNEFLDALPHLHGMRVFLIDGNHCSTFTERTGVESGRNLVRLARERGRDDLQFFGSRGALIQYGETRIEMWHPKKGAAYALSYQMQNHIRDTAPERLAHLLLTGHTHQYVKFRRSNCWAWYCGTFQHGDAPYGRSLGGDVSMGGLIIDWRIDEDGVVRELSDKFHLAHHEARRFDVAV